MVNSEFLDEKRLIHSALTDSARRPSTSAIPVLHYSKVMTVAESEMAVQARLTLAVMAIVKEGWEMGLRAWAEGNDKATDPPRQMRGMFMMIMVPVISLQVGTISTET